MSDEESEVDVASEVEAEELEEEDIEDAAKLTKKRKEIVEEGKRNNVATTGKDKITELPTDLTSRKNRKQNEEGGKRGPKDKPSLSSSSNSSSSSTQQVGSPKAQNAAIAHMTFDGDGNISDEIANSWEEDVSESDEDAENYYDEEEETKKEGGSEGNKDNQADSEAIVEDDDDLEDDGTGGRLLMNIHCTEYDVIKKVARKGLGFKLRNYAEDHDGAIRKGERNQKLVKEWDVTWHDLSITPDFLAKLNPYQKVNHYPGMYSITRKNHLARNLMRMKRAFPDEFTFFPQTWVLPGDNIDFRNQFAGGGRGKDEPRSKKRQTFIVKPDGLSQGKGIFLSRRMDKILNTIETAKDEEGIGGWVVQHYVDQPHLIDDLKYDLRIYVLINCVNPLRIYIHEEGLARFCTEPYKRPTARNMSNLYMHLTNYAINKFSDAYAQAEESSCDEESGHKRSLKAIMKILECCGADSDKLQSEIKDIIVKTVCASQPYLSHLYRSCQPEDLDGSMCFQILGFDIMIDNKFKPWLIEVNQCPSFATDSPLDYKTKKAVLTDTFRMLNCSFKKRSRILKEQQELMASRILTGKQAKLEPEEKAKLKEKKLQQRFRWEEKRCGQWELICPWPNEQRNATINVFIKKAQEIWDEFTTGKGKRVLQVEDKRGQNTSNLAKASATKQGFGHSKISLTNTASTANLRNTKPSFFNKPAVGYLMRDQLTQPKFEPVVRHEDENRISNYQVSPIRNSGIGYQTQPSQGVTRINIGQQKLVHKPPPELTCLKQKPFQMGVGSSSLRKKAPQVVNTPRQQSTMHLDVIEHSQQSHEGSSSLLNQARPSVNLTYDSSLERISSSHQHQQYQAHPPSSKQKFAMNCFSSQQADSVLDHLKLLTQPGNHNQAPVMNIKYEKSRLEQQTNILVQRMEAEKLRNKQYIFNSKQDFIAQNLQHSDSKSSFKDKQIQAQYQGLGPSPASKEPGSDIMASPNYTLRSIHTRKQSKESSQRAASGKEQINFMIPTNYSAAKMRLEEFKQQVSNLSLDQQALISQAYHQNTLPRDLIASQIPPFTTTFQQKMTSAMPSMIKSPVSNGGIVNKPWNLSKPQSMLLQQKEMLESMRRIDSSGNQDQIDRQTGAVDGQSNLKTFSERTHKSHTITDKKILPSGPVGNAYGMTSQQTQDESIAMRSDHKLTTGRKVAYAHELEGYDSGSVGNATEDPRAATVGIKNSGFPPVLSPSQQSKDTTGGNELATRSIALTSSKQAVKLTQMPFYIENKYQQNLTQISGVMLRTKDTPQQQFNNLPGINNNSNSNYNNTVGNELQLAHPSELLMSAMHGQGAPQIKTGSKTVTRTQTKKLDSLFAANISNAPPLIPRSLHNSNNVHQSRFGAQQNQANSAQLQKTSGMMKARPSYVLNKLYQQENIEEDLWRHQDGGGVYMPSHKGSSLRGSKQQPISRTSIHGSLGLPSSHIESATEQKQTMTVTSQQQPQDTIAGNSNRINDRVKVGAVAAKSTSLTPFQLYQQQQQMQQQQKMMQRGGANGRDLASPTYQPRPYQHNQEQKQQQRQSHQQENQILLQSSVNYANSGRQQAVGQVNAPRDGSVTGAIKSGSSTENANRRLSRTIGQGKSARAVDLVGAAISAGAAAVAAEQSSPMLSSPTLKKHQMSRQKLKLSNKKQKNQT